MDTIELNFGQALEHLKDGKRVTREGWNGPDQYIELQKPDEHSKMKRQYLFIVPVDGMPVPWVASQTDIFATDWAVVLN